MPAESSQTPLLVLMAKRPARGVGKQRIAAQFGLARTQALAEHLFACAVEDLEAWPHARAIAIASAADLPWADRLLCDCTTVAQSEGNLGERLASVHAELYVPGRPILFIGADSPALDQAYLAHCLAALTTHDVVLGQASDGGVVVMGSRSPWPALDTLPWSTPRLGAALFDQCRADGLSVVTREPLEDIDTFDQLRDLAARLETDPRPARAALREWLHVVLPQVANAQSAIG